MNQQELIEKEIEKFEKKFKILDTKTGKEYQILSPDENEFLINFLRESLKRMSDKSMEAVIEKRVDTSIVPFNKQNLYYKLRGWNRCCDKQQEKRNQFTNKSPNQV